MTVEFITPSGLIAELDDEDADLLRYAWKHKEPPKKLHLRRHNKDRKNESLHRVVMERILGRPLLPEEQVDHKDRNVLNNRRGNLRTATHTQNRINSVRKSKYGPGVVFDPRMKNRPYQAILAIDGKRTSLGYYETAQEASNVHKAAHRELHGDFSPYADED